MNKLGFGFLRLPGVEGEDATNVDWELVNRLVDAFLAGGGTYFDSAYTYLGGASEAGLGRCLSARYPRETFRIATKLPGYMVKEYADCERFFQTQLQRCGVDWFDVYLIHWLNPRHYALAEKTEQFRFLRQVKGDGRAKKIGFSYHGDAALLERILTEHPEVDIVQLQINYLDWEDPGIESRACYETAMRHGKEVVVMEPVKGGTLAALPEDALALLNAHAPGESPASWAIRFAQELPGVSVVLSGMNTLAQIEDNLRDMPALSGEEHGILDAVCRILNRSIAIPCTGCRYCESHCPKKIAIPDYFRVYNSYCRHPEEDWKMTPVYNRIAASHGRASECIGCGVCRANCPQGIPIPDWMPKIAGVMEK